jgi:hypothetical protein
VMCSCLQDLSVLCACSQDLLCCSRGSRSRLQDVSELATLCPELESVFLDSPPAGWGGLRLPNRALRLYKIKANKVLRGSDIPLHRWKSCKHLSLEPVASHTVNFVTRIWEITCMYSTHIKYFEEIPAL